MKTTQDIVHNEDVLVSRYSKVNRASDQVRNDGKDDFTGSYVLAYYSTGREWCRGLLLDEDFSGDVLMFKVELDIGLTIWTADVAECPF